MNLFKSVKNNYLFWLILLLACFLRLYKLATIPYGINQDEAFTGYEALSLLTNGTDSWEYPFPVYFISWGSGTSVLYAYLTIPLFALFGPSLIWLRLPQALFGILSCYIFYRLLRLFCTKKQSLIGFFLASVVPWHIMLSRWGLDANLVSFFILTGFYFYARSFKKINYLYLSAVFYGVGMYAYATSWIYIVITFGINLLYLFFIRPNKQTFFAVFCAGLIFSFFSLPLLLFLLINYGIIPEIKTSFFSIPKLIYFRKNEIGTGDLGIKLSALQRILFKGDDYLITNHISPFGLFYPISLPFIILGLFLMGKDFIKKIATKRVSVLGLVFTQIIIGLIYGSMLYPCINRLNFLWFNLLIALTVGINFFQNYRKILSVILLSYIAALIMFCHTYFTKYPQMAAQNFTPDLEPVLMAAEKVREEHPLPIAVLSSPSIFPKILFYQKVPVHDFYSTVKWLDFSAAYLDASRFTHYIFLPKFDYSFIPTNKIYIAPNIAPKKLKYWFYQFDIQFFGDYILATPQKYKKPF